MPGKKAQYYLIILVAVILGLVYYFLSPSESEIFPTCIFKNVTGLDCPGCGGQRAFHELLHFNFANAFRHNPLLVAAIPMIIIGTLYYNSPFKKLFPKINRFIFGQWGILASILTILVFFIVRNL